MPRNVRVKKEEPEVDFKTRMAQMSKQKFAPKKGLFVKKEEPEIKKEKNSKEFKKERRRRNSSSSEDSEEEDRRITKKAKKKLGLSVCKLVTKFENKTNFNFSKIWQRLKNI
jgi:hypothetical protein